MTINITNKIDSEIEEGVMDFLKIGKTPEDFKKWGEKKIKDHIYLQKKTLLESDFTGEYKIFFDNYEIKDILITKDKTRKQVHDEIKKEFERFQSELTMVMSGSIKKIVTDSDLLLNSPSDFMHGYLLYKDNIDYFSEKYIFGKNPPQTKQISFFLASCFIDQEARRIFSYSIAKSLYNKISKIQEEIFASINDFDKYKVGRKLDFMRDFTKKWCNGDNEDRGGIFSPNDILTIKDMTEALKPTFEVVDTISKIEVSLK